MKRRKVVGLVLIIATFVYFIASLLAFYQNQRVSMEKGIEEALKAYSGQESQSIKELSNDLNLQLNEKMSLTEGKQQVLKFEGSFARIENSISNVTDEMALVEYNINNLDERLTITENFYNELYQEITEKYELYEDQFLEINQTNMEIVKNIEEIEIDIKKLEQMIAENDGKQNQNMEEVKTQLEELTVQVSHLLSNALLYQYDAQNQTLHVFGEEADESNEE